MRNRAADRPSAAPPRRRAEPIEAPPELVLGGDESPVPGPATTSVPPRKAKAPRQTPLARLMSVGLGVSTVLAASLGVGWAARRYVTQSPRFAVRTVLVDGVHRHTAEHVAGLGRVAIGQNIFAIDLGRAARAIEQDPYIERAVVRRKLPGSISIEVVEREAVALASIAGPLYLVTRDGEPFKKVGDGDPVDLPVVTGISAELVTRDREGAMLLMRRALDVVAELDRVGLSRRAPLQELHLEKDGSLVVTLGREGILVHLGKGPYGERVAQAARVMAEVERRKGVASVIFADNSAHPERVVVRMR